VTRGGIWVLCFRLAGVALIALIISQHAPPTYSALVDPTADKQPGFPCRISLVDAEPGEELLLLPYCHQPADSPYQASGPIFIRSGARQRIGEPSEVPPYVSGRLISARAYDARDFIVDAEVCAGTEAAATIRRMLENPGVRYLHLHNAKRGCFSCRVERA